MRLIDAEPFDFNKVIIPDGGANFMRGYGLGAKHVCDEIAAAPTVDAVPIKPLCAWLAGVAAGNQSICCECAGSNDAPCPDENELCKDPQAWERHIRAWMQKEGLDAAD